MGMGTAVEWAGPPSSPPSWDASSIIHYWRHSHLLCAEPSQATARTNKGLWTDTAAVANAIAVIR